MTYFTLQRVITFCIGIVLIYSSFLIFETENVTREWISYMVAFSGIYITIASLISYKETNRGIGEIVFEGILHFFMDTLFKGIFRFIGKIID